MRTLMAFVMALTLLSCGQRNGQEGAANEDKTAADEQGFTMDERVLIDQVSDLDCRLYTLYAQAFGEPESPEVVAEIKSLREEKRVLIGKIMEMNSDSLHLTAVRDELKRLSDLDDYCPELKKFDTSESKGDKDGVPVKSLQISDDAAKLARMNCRILQAHLKLEENQADAEAKKHLSQLLQSKRIFLNQLMLMYGHDILRDESFRAMVMDVQDQECQYRTELKKHNRMTPFIP
ncbi:MAG: hypothetical protein R6V49_03475 [Bacteroidales bacterium]